MAWCAPKSWPGSTVDVFARLIGQKLNEKWGVPVIIENHPGAGGVISMEKVARAPADGYTLTLTTEGMTTIVPHLRREPRYSALSDFAPVTRVASAPYVLVVNPSLPISSTLSQGAAADPLPDRERRRTHRRRSREHSCQEQRSQCACTCRRGAVAAVNPTGRPPAH
jgi:tripartite-type tricarboxylate transporter receptor subunit TctC